MSAAVSQQYEWIPEIDRTALTGGRYRMAVLVPSTWTSAITQTYLESKGWNVVSIGAPPPDVAAALATVTPAGMVGPLGWWVIATWTGAQNTVIPQTDGQIYYATLDFYSPIAAGETPIGAVPPAPPTASYWPALLGFVAGASAIGWLAHLSKTGAFHHGGHSLANPIRAGSMRSNPLITDRMKIMQAAVSRGGAPDYLYDRATLVRWELAGLVYLATQHADFDVYKATDAGKAAFARGTLP
jgi:hypothetical protein